MYDLTTMEVRALWIHYSVYHDHNAGIELCNRANDGDKEAEPFAQQIWNEAEKTRELRAKRITVKMVRHVNQGVTEYWTHSEVYGWQQMDQGTADLIPINCFEYMELRHDMDNHAGHYGPYIRY